MDKSRPQFALKRGQKYGDRLIWRYPGTNPDVRRQMLKPLAPLGITELPKSITIGYYRRAEDPPNAWMFMPSSTPLAVTALGIEMVQVRICDDLAMMAAEGQQ